MKRSNVTDLVAKQHIDAELSSRVHTILLNKPLEPNLDKVMGYLKGVHERAWYTNFGELHDVLTNRLENYFGVENLLLVNNGTTALQVAAKVLASKHVWTTPYSFAATSSAMQWQGIPVSYSDIDPATLSPNICLLDETLSKNPQIDLLLPAHIYGSPCGIDEIQKVADKHKVKVLYDAAQCFGVNYREESILSYGDASIISFHATKMFHTVEGGAICFKHKDDYLLAKRMINFGFNGEKIESEGINGKLNEYQAAVGLTLLDEMDGVLSHRKNLFLQYRDRLKGIVGLQEWSEHASPNGGYMPIVLPSSFHAIKIMKALKEQHIQGRIYFKEPLHKVYGEGYHCPVTDSLVPRVITLPLHYFMHEQDVERICDIVINNV